MSEPLLPSLRLSIVTAIVLTELCSAPLHIFAQPTDATPAPTAVNKPTNDADRLFELATELIASNQYQAATDHLLRLAKDFPQSGNIPEALFLAGGLLEEQLDQPTAAMDAYRQIAEDFPDSRVALASSRRLAALNILSGDSPRDHKHLSQFLAIRRQVLDIGDERALNLAEKLLAEAPGWHSAAQVQLWMAGVYLRNGKDKRAEQLYHLALKSSDSAVVFEATLAAAALARNRGDFTQAAILVEQLDTADSPGRREAQREARLANQTLQRRQRLSWVAGISLIAVVLLLASFIWRGREHTGGLGKALWPPPGETIYLLPILAAFTLAASTGHNGIAKAVGMIATAGLLISWLSGAAIRSGEGRGCRLLCAMASGAAIIAIFYLAVLRNNLIDLIVSTVRFGPDV